MVGFTLRTKSTFTALKSLARPALLRHHAWLYPDTLEFSQLDIVPLGFLTHTNPRFHSTARLADEVHDHIIDNYEDLDDAVRRKFQDEYMDEFFDDNNTMTPPTILIAPANVNSGDKATRAYEIQVERAYVPSMKTMLEEIYAIIPLTATSLKFIPYSLKYDSPDISRSVVRTQNEYIDTHRNIPLAGVTIDQMQESITWNGIEQTPFEILTSLAGVTRIDTTGRTHDLGKFNISTTASSYAENISWIDAKLAAIFELTMTTDKLEESDFPHPVRMGRRPVRPRPTKQKSAYAEHLRSQFATTVGTPPPLLVMPGRTTTAPLLSLLTLLTTSLPYRLPTVLPIAPNL
jgi:hypothetical protein